MTSVDWTRQVLVNGAMSPKAVSAFVAKTARQALAEAQALNESVLGHVPPHTTWVDGNEGAAEETVKPDGRIIHEFNTGLRVEILDWIMEQLRDTAPVKSGRFRDAMQIFADWTLVDDFAMAANADEIVIVSTVAYARKIEGARDANGKTRRGPLSPQAPNGVFEAVSAVASARFGNIAKIKFTFAAPLSRGTHLDEWASGTKQTRKRFTPETPDRKRRRGEWNRRNPAISIRFGRGRDAQL